MTDTWAQEKTAAIRAVRRAAEVCKAVQQQMVDSDTLQKKDRSPVTVADFASQAVVCALLGEAFPDDPVVGEENAQELRQADRTVIRQAVVERVRVAMGGSVDQQRVLDWIDRGGASQSTGRFWTLDPIDGTKGFLRNEQYAVALALIESGRVVLGLLGCPNLPTTQGTGALLVAAQGQGTQVLPLWSDTQQGQPAHVSKLTQASQARFCESVESGHSSHGAAAKIAQVLGINTEPIRMDSQVKYALVAQGQATIYLRLPTRADYRENIWDHAAGMIAVEQAGGRVTDITGKPLDFTHGRNLEANQGIVATNGSIHNQVIEAVQQVLSNAVA